MRGKPEPYRPVSRDPFDPEEVLEWTDTKQPFQPGSSQQKHPAVSSVVANQPVDSSDTSPLTARRTELTPAPPRPAPRQHRSNSTRTKANEFTVPVSELPKYIKLAYQPPAPTPLHKLPKDYWAVQIVAVNNLDRLKRFVEDNQLLGMIGAELQTANGTMFALLLGVYESREIAAQAAAARPAALQKFEPYVRSMRSLHASMRASGREAEPTKAASTAQISRPSGKDSSAGG
ncbi:MAG: SPOR domain-containing protein [Pseudomonadota bacterium]